jgi:C-terminal processing protease CtpA/Prc
MDMPINPYTLSKLPLELTMWPSLQRRTTEHRFVFTLGPLGVRFEAGQTPLTVEEVDAQGFARQVGVKVGMIVCKIDGEDVSRVMSYDSLYGHIRQRVMELTPMVPKIYEDQSRS